MAVLLESDTNIIKKFCQHNTFIEVCYGAILRSTENGSSWDNVTSPTTTPALVLNTVIFWNDTFVAVGNSGNILKYKDNGTTWDNVTSPTTESLKGVGFLE